MNTTQNAGEGTLTTTRSSRRWRRLAAIIAAGTSLLIGSSGARAYSGSEHMRFPDQAYQIMNIVRHGGGAFYGVRAGQPKLTDCPASICTPTACPGGCGGGSSCAACTQWNRYIAQVMAAPPRLDNVLVDLPDPVLPQTDCAGVFPVLPQGKHLAACRAGDLPFAPRRGWGDGANECYLRRGYMFGGADQLGDPPDVNIRPFFQDLPSNFTGAVLGKWATGPDDEFHDTALWFRPSNLGIGSEIKGLAEEAVDIGLTIIVAPFFCISDFIFGGGDCVGDAGSFSHTVDPVTLADESLGIIELDVFGNGTVTSDDSPLKGKVILQGLWHFAQVWQEGQFNKVPGYKATQASLKAAAGPDGWSPLDAAVIAICDLLGLTIHPIKSTGVDHYSRFADGALRVVGDWIDPTMGHVEFEPVDNLARFGWDNFVTHAEGARGLGWVLHAIGDAGQPHHTVGVLGWGHNPWETFALLSWQSNFQENVIGAHYPHLAAAMAHGFRWWKFMDDLQTQRGTTALPVGEMVEALAQETFSLPVSRFGHAFQQVNLLDTPSPDHGDILDTFGPEAANMRDLMERAIGASIGFLAKASDFVPAVTSSPCACPAGQARFAETAAGDIIPARDGNCHACGSLPFEGMPNLSEGECVAACPPDKPTVVSGVCTAVDACSAATPFFENGACVGKCSDNSVVVNNRDCVAGGCPAGTTLEESSHFCIPTPPTKSRAICSAQNGDGQGACCGADAGFCVSDTDCCSGSCRSDGICRSGAGRSCAIGNDCLSGSCTSGVCRPSGTGQPCAANGDCASFACENKICKPGEPGRPCAGGGDCLSGICGNEPGVCLGRGGDYCQGQDSLCVSNVCLGGFCAGANGESCNSNGGCASGLCLNGVCKGGTGSSCSGNSGCASNMCQGGICKVGRGGACQSNADCASDAICSQASGTCCGATGSSCGINNDCCSQDCSGGPSGTCVFGPG